MIYNTYPQIYTMDFLMSLTILYTLNELIDSANKYYGVEERE